jgi:hypothetical protein
MALGVAPVTWAVDDSKVNAATERVEKGAEGAKYTGES